MRRILSYGLETYLIWLRVSSEADYEYPLDNINVRK